jgi:cytochrome c peroxidase
MPRQSPAGRRAPAANTNEFTQAEFNFAVFGVSPSAYEATLVSDNSRYDQFAEETLSSHRSGANRLNIFEEMEDATTVTGS